jgi:hypothetical protein
MKSENNFLKDSPTYTLIMEIQFPQTMRPEGIRDYILSRIFFNEWGGAFQTNYITVDPESVKITRESDAIELLKKKVAWGKEIDKNHLFDYHAIGKMIEEAEQRIESFNNPEGAD